jgi:hypothetical protein
LVFAGNSGVLDADPWLVLGITASPNSVSVGGTSTLTADLTKQSPLPGTASGGFVPNGTPVAFAGVLGTVISHQYDYYFRPGDLHLYGHRAWSWQRFKHS